MDDEHNNSFNNEGMLKMTKFLNKVMNKLRPLGLSNTLKDLPHIAVIGSQSAGKSSVLENIVGRDFLPRGKDIVTRRPLILQLIQNRDTTETFAVFDYSKTIYYDFNEVRNEIEAATDRLVRGQEISAEPINLTITSPDVFDLTLVDLPGLTKNPIGNQPQDIEQVVRNIILAHIRNEKCLILAVTPANVDLANSDAINLAREVDKDGKRTIGVLTKIDLMDKGTNARDILLNNHGVKLKRGFIGVINRSQEDINGRKDMRLALDNEMEFFRRNPSYNDILHKTGTKNLQNLLNHELSKYFLNDLPSLKHRFESELFLIEEKIDAMTFDDSELEKEALIAKTIDMFGKYFKNEVGGPGAKVRTDKLNGGVKINKMLNLKYPGEIDNISIEGNSMRKQIAIAIQNIFGPYLQNFIPNEAFIVVVCEQIELFRNPSRTCVDYVSMYLEEIVKECANKIDRFPKLIELYTSFTLEFVRQCKKICKRYVDHKVDTELSYFNAIHGDFLRAISEKGIKAVHGVPMSKFILNEFCDANDDVYSFNAKVDDQEYWMDKNHGSLFIFSDKLKTNKIATIDKVQKEHMKEEGSIVTLVGDVVSDILPSGKPLKLAFNCASKVNEFMDHFIGDSGKGSEDESDIESIGSNNECIFDEEFPKEIEPQVKQVMKLVKLYVNIVKDIFKDTLPKLCQKELIDSIQYFIEVKLRQKVSENIETIEELINDDTMKDELDDQKEKFQLYRDALDIINEAMKEFPHLFSDNIVQTIEEN